MMVAFDPSILIFPNSNDSNHENIAGTSAAAAFASASTGASASMVASTGPSSDHIVLSILVSVQATGDNQKKVRELT